VDKMKAWPGLAEASISLFLLPRSLAFSAEKSYYNDDWRFALCQ